MPLRESFDVCLVDDRLVPGRPRRFVTLPVRRGIDDGGERRERGVVAFVARAIGSGIANPISEHRVIPAEVPSDGLRVRINQQFAALKRRPRSGSYGP
jgi:hypothetical protein